jgi:hypothetical protein
MEEKIPTISFYCFCRKRLYRVGTNVLEIRGQLKCERCEQRYVLLDSLIAVPVSSVRAGRSELLKLKPIHPIGHTRYQRE